MTGEKYGFGLDEEFDPLDENGFEPLYLGETEEGDPDAIEDIPTLPNMPEGVVKKGAYDASSYDDPREAIRLLFQKNPGRRPVFLSIIEMAIDGIATSELTEKVDEIQAHNYSVYSPVTLARTLERAGALSVEIPESADSHEAEDGAEYLEITGEVDPVWMATPAGLSVLEEERAGRAIRELLDHEAQYVKIYERVLAFCSEIPRTKQELNEIVDNDPLVQEPRRYSNHFIELLEKADALVWMDKKWTITDLGKRTLAEMQTEDITEEV